MKLMTGNKKADGCVRKRVQDHRSVVEGAARGSAARGPIGTDMMRLRAPALSATEHISLWQIYE
ncbi:hypothetical protein JYU34_002533 [Plutella xylostella]|uniref:Uncharacterized protein n=1 Tax=Plutella xylostella TaxID=51655 RepID=A0ABQ7R2H3_PLUXY|nr:hypothetical protein JYU34_002533 [Plutella xylostella]